MPSNANSSVLDLHVSSESSFDSECESQFRNRYSLHFAMELHRMSFTQHIFVDLSINIVAGAGISTSHRNDAISLRCKFRQLIETTTNQSYYYFEKKHANVQTMSDVSEIQSRCFCKHASAVPFHDFICKKLWFTKIIELTCSVMCVCVCVCACVCVCLCEIVQTLSNVSSFQVSVTSSAHKCVSAEESTSRF